ncbi:uncharacterized protein [Onthophagus taurus]|uniref:uncharacterized protein n=1 Tax=Onthophagus taurus TaxID=166361 RepID=UPI000C205FA6|nr:uncharacterized protein LOC111425288 [Onthophagus taurus]
MLSDADARHPSLKSVLIEKDETGNCGFHLTRSKWDPYPWITSIDPGSSAEKSGLMNGDCLLEVNGEDVLGQKISDIASLVKKTSNVTLFLWNSGVDDLCSPETICSGPMPRNFQKLTACTSSILGFLECPICLDTIGPPSYQCDNGHLICIRCRSKTERCPICRNRLNRGRSLLADQIYNVITEIFELKETPGNIRNNKIQQIFKIPQKKEIKVPDIKVTHAHANKFLAKLVGKSSSVDNLSTNNTSSNLGLSDNSLKTKSLSSTEIFNGSPTVSRSNSIKKSYKNSRLGASSSISCHNSFENLNRVDDEARFISCPFEQSCSNPIDSSNLILEHFQINHTGPLIQYFNSSFKLFPKNIHDVNNTYVINYFNKIFIVKILNEKPNNFHIWSWVNNNKDGDTFYMVLKVSHKNETFLNISLPCYPINKKWKDINQMKHGVNFSSTEFFSIDDVILEIIINTQNK